MRAKMIAPILFAFLLLPATAGATEDITLQLKWKHAFQFAGFYMAQEKGYYSEQGLHVTLLEGGPGKNPIDHVLAAEGNYGISDTGIVLARASGKPIKALAAIFQHSPLALAVKADSGIRSFADLKGKRIMMQTDHMDAVILAAMKKAGVGEGDFTRQDTSFNLQDLVAGNTDAFSIYITDQPHQLMEMGIAHRVLRPGDSGIDFYGDLLITSDGEISKHPARVRAFVEASEKGWDYALSHVDETIALILNKYNSQNLSKSQLYFEAHKTSDMMLKDVVHLGYMSEQRWERIASSYAELGLLKADFPVSALIYEEKPTFSDFLIRYSWQLAVSALIALLLILSLQTLLLRRMVRSRTAALSESETRFRTLVANLPGVSYRCRCDEDRNMDFISDAIQAMAGYPAAEFHGNKVRTFNSIIHPDDRTHVREAIMEGIRNQCGFSIEYRIVRADVQTRWVHERGQPIFDDRGAAIWLDGNIFDITERKQAEGLRESTAAILEMVASDKPLTQIFEAIIRIYEARYPDMRASILLLRDGRLFNGAAPSLPEAYNAALEGIEIGPMVGSCGTAAFYKRRTIVEDIEHDPRWAAYTDLVLPMNLRACWSEPIFSSAGDVLGTFAMYYDHPCAPSPAEITDISNAAKLTGLAIERGQHIAQLKKLSSAIEQSSEVITILNKDGVIEYTNPAYTLITGYSAAEAIGKTPRLLRNAESKPMVEQMLAAFGRGNPGRARAWKKRRAGISIRPC